MTGVGGPTTSAWPTTYSTGGLVASVDHLASAAGAQLRAAGGSAADAAIAASAVLAVSDGVAAAVPACAPGARVAASASTQRDAHRHHRSPAFNPAKPNSGRGVLRSLPAEALKARNSSVMTAHTVCTPTSSAPVSQQPLR